MQNLYKLSTLTLSAGIETLCERCAKAFKAFIVHIGFRIDMLDNVRSLTDSGLAHPCVIHTLISNGVILMEWLLCTLFYPQAVIWLSNWDGECRGA